MEYSPLARPSLRALATISGQPVTARLKSLTKQLGCGLHVSAEVAQHLFAEGRACTQNLGAFAVKGEREAVGLVEILTSDAAALREAKAASREALAHALAHYTDAALVEALTIVRKIAEAAPGDGAPHWRLARMQHELASVALRAPTASCASTTRGPRLRVEDQHPHVVDQVRPHGGSEASGSNKPG